MCGICGMALADPHGRAREDLVVAMRDTMSHRGPDGAGIVSLPGASLAQRRLSIIDLELGKQPMANEDESIWVTFNGEIYNYLDLRRDLVARGHRFHTRSDTEVLVHAYEEFGDAFVERLNGIFGLALYDVPRRRLLLARDHLGVKPVFYAVVGERLLFASEIKGVLAGLDRRPRLRDEGLQEYLVFRYIAWDRTFYEQVRRLPPGHLAVWENGRLAVRRYWSPSARPERGLGLDDAVARLDAELGGAVERQLMSDVPLGSFCSGGVDSGLVTAYAARGSAAFQSFSVGFAEAEWDETALAADTARRAGAEHHTVVATAGAVEQDLPHLIHHHDEPLSHPNAAPLCTLSEFARRRVKVVLTGEGADELFCGYPRYHIARLRGALERMPGAARGALAAVLRRLPGHRAAKAAFLVPRSLEDAIMLNSAYVDPALVATLTGSPVRDALDGRRQLVAETLDPRDAVSSLSRYELLTYLTSCLDRMDRMSMAHGLEGRVPFLDIGLVEFGLRLPPELKLRGTQNKRVVKALARRFLSPSVVLGPKSGFGLPLDAWFRGSGFQGVRERMRDPSHPAFQHLDPAVVAQVARAHETGAADHGELLWLVANVFLWCEREASAGGTATRRSVTTAATR